MKIIHWGFFSPFNTKKLIGSLSLVCMLLSIGFIQPLVSTLATSSNLSNPPSPPLLTTFSWGNNQYGNLGQGTSRTSASIPQQVTNPTPGVTFTSYFPASNHALGMGSDNKLYAWGRNYASELGNGTNVDSKVPVPVSLPSGAPGGFHYTSFEARGSINVAKGSDGKLYMWGAGYLGHPDSSNSNLPVPVDNPTGTTAGFSFSSFAVGDGHVLALGNDLNLYSWGNNSWGQLGNGSRDASFVPLPVSLPTGVPVGFHFTKIWANSDNSLALGSDNKLYGWGHDNNNELGLGDGVNGPIVTPLPVAAPIGVSFTGVVMGVGHTFGYGSDGKIYGWGSYGNGELGIGSENAVNHPIDLGVLDGLGMTNLAAGNLYSLGFGSDGTLYSWGGNYINQLGNGGYWNRPAEPYKLLSPLPVQLPTGVAAGFHFVSAKAGLQFGLALGSDGNLYAWGENSTYQLGGGTDYGSNSHPAKVLLPPGAGNGFKFTAISAGAVHNLGLGNDGVVYAWGHGYNGELGNGVNLDLNLPFPVSTGSPLFQAISAGNEFSLGLTTGGALYAWGHDYYNELGNGDGGEKSSPSPVDVSGLPGGLTFSAISAGDRFSLALASNNNVYSWGQNGSGQLGNGTTNVSKTPGAVSNPVGVHFVAIAAGAKHALAKGSDGKLYSWGDNSHGELGNGNTTNRPSPAAVPAPTGASGSFNYTDFSAGNLFSLALGNDGKLYAWGFNAYGQLGNGNTTDSSRPVQVSNPTGTGAGFHFTAIRAADGFSLALGNDNKLYAFGYNQDGRLGDNTVLNRTVPVPAALTGGYGIGGFFSGPVGTSAFALLNIPQATSLAVGNVTATVNSLTNLTATLSSNSAGVSGVTIGFSLNNKNVGTATTNGSGVATLNNVNLSGISAGNYPGGITASFNGNSSYLASQGSGNLTLNNPVPTLTSLDLSTGYQQMDSLTTLATGTNFTLNSVVKFNGVDQETQYISPTQLRVTFNKTALSTTGTFLVLVTNPTPGGGNSGSVNFTVSPLDQIVSTQEDTGSTGTFSYAVSHATHAIGFSTQTVKLHNAVNIPAGIYLVAGCNQRVTFSLGTGLVSLPGGLTLSGNNFLQGLIFSNVHTTGITLNLNHSKGNNFKCLSVSV
ncbi:MAG: hypothetical protein BGO39_15875 [Chloroflexi bacterium 54-19]|nr:MAG: hypothetical protein BGO39_15875 [Chloroflexi bacterium 54-19]